MKPIARLKQKALEFFPRQTPVFIEIRGQNLVLAEGYCRIEFYSEAELCLSSPQSKIQINGTELTLRHLSDQRIAIEGSISKLEFL